MEEQVYLNGEIIPANEARISILDAGLTHGAGLFETLRVYGGRAMRFEDHMKRLSRSAATLDLQIEVDRDAIARGIEDVLAANDLQDARLRITLTAGTMARVEQQHGELPKPTTLIAACPVQGYPQELYRRGMRVCICPYKQSRLDPVAGHKTLAYLPRLMAVKEAAERKCHESLWFTTDNLLAEGSVCNVFIVAHGVIATPPHSTPILPGIVRKAVIELAEQSGIPFEERPIDINALLAAQEVFLTGSVLEIMPVTAIEKHKVGGGAPGEMTKRMRRLYADLVAKECGVERSIEE